MKGLPKKLLICPIEEAVIQIRFKTSLPDEAVFGVMYSALKGDLKGWKLTNLPLQQLPEQMRQHDPKLKYQALYRLEKDNIGINIGPRTIIFGNISQYVGWDKLSAFFNGIITSLSDIQNFFEEFERVGLRYINLFDGNILNHINSNFELLDMNLQDKTSNIRTEFTKKQFNIILNIGNSVKIFKDKEKFRKSIVDIDCVTNLRGKNFMRNYMEIINNAHDIEKEIFFSMLHEEYLNKFNPEY